MTWNNSIFPLLVVTSGSGFTGLFVYSPAPGTGNLILSVAASAGTDPYGNQYFTRLGVYSPGVPASQLTGNTLQFRSVASPPSGTPSVSGPSASPTGTLLALVSGQGTAGATASNMQLFDSLQDAVQGGTGVPQIVVNSGAFANPLTSALLDLQGSLGFKGIAAPAAPPAGSTILFADTSGFLRMLTGLAGDTNSYFTAYTDAGGSALPQTISSTTATTITGCTLPVGIGQYAFRARVIFQGGVAAGTANFSMSAPANTSPSIGAAFNMSSGTAGAGVQLAALGPVNSPTLTTGNSIAEIEGEVTFTAAGNLILQCAEGTAGDTVIIEKARLWLYPIL